MQHLEIIKLDEFGRGITYVDGKITFVLDAVVGDIVDIKLTKQKKNYNEAEVVKYVKLSDKRLKPLCSFFGLCGGCHFQELSYEEEIKCKKDNVINYFKKNTLDIKPQVITGKTFYYRNKITLKVVNGVIGYYEEKSHTLVSVDKCVIAREKINKIIPLIKEIKIKNGEVVIRINKKDEVLLIINSCDYLEFKEEFKKYFKGIVLNKRIVFGVDYLEESLNGITYKISYNSFFQVNELASTIFKLVEDEISKDDIVLDLYSGVGTLALSAAKSKAKVQGIEVIENAVENAQENARINKMDNATFEVGNLDKIDGSFKFNKLIVDPPRSGLSNDVIEMIKKNKPDTIIYISCDYHTQVRDVLKLDDYKIKKAYLIDLFARTYHIESMLILEKRII